MSEIKATRTRNLRYKRPALASMGFDTMMAELEEIESACSDVHWFADQDDETLINALDGDEEEAWEFKLAFADNVRRSISLTSCWRPCLTAAG